MFRGNLKSRETKRLTLLKTKEEIKVKKEELQRSEETRQMLVAGMQQKQAASESELKELKETIARYEANYREELVQVTRLEAEVSLTRKRIQEKQQQAESERD